MPATGTGAKWLYPWGMSCYFHDLLSVLLHRNCTRPIKFRRRITAMEPMTSQGVNMKVAKSVLKNLTCVSEPFDTSLQSVPVISDSGKCSHDKNTQKAQWLPDPYLTLLVYVKTMVLWPSLTDLSEELPHLQLLSVFCRDTPCMYALRFPFVMIRW